MQIHVINLTLFTETKVNLYIRKMNHRGIRAGFGEKDRGVAACAWTRLCALTHNGLCRRTIL